MNSPDWSGNFTHHEIDIIARKVRVIIKEEELGYQNVQTLFGDMKIIEDETLPPNTIVMKSKK